jgi:hypothetical protein
MNFYVFNYQHKGKPYFNALRSRGHKPIARIADVSLFDRDIYITAPSHTVAHVQQQIDRGSKIIIYPHSALPPWWYDGLVDVKDYLAAVIVIGEGQKEAMKIIAPNTKTIVCGWPWCTQKPFSAPDKVKRVLFAPIHPSGGRLRPEALQANKQIFRELKHVQRAMDLEVTVRYIHDLDKQGLKPYGKFRWIKGATDGNTKDIDEADVVIAEGTMMYLAVARGKPTIGINQHLPARANKNSDKYTPHNWDKYGPDIAYPINYQEGRLGELIEQAAAGEQTEWRERLIGESLDPFKFSALIEEIWRENKRV